MLMRPIICKYVALSGLALGVAVADASSVKAATLYSETVTLTPGTDYMSGWFSIAAGTPYDFMWSLVTSSGLSSASRGAYDISLLDSSGTVAADLGGNIVNIYNGLVGSSTGGTAAGGLYQVEYQAYGKNFNSVTVTATVTAVPGPIAGAGLPALAALIGFGWLRRKAAAI